ncbi:MAG TPA: hypothetical protein VEH62_00680 [Gemmatimonadales bacterium]|nr:hypothetical protein [Gemmatimonadales bacterium]
MKGTTLTALAVLLAAPALLFSPPTSEAQQPPTLGELPMQNTPAFTTALEQHHMEISRLANPAEAGIWLVQDSTGHLVSSGVLPKFPAAIGADTYATVVPGAAGLRAIAFGFARTPAMNGCGPFRVAYVTVPVAPPPGGGPS